jgi:hypothetical protein
MDFGMILDGSSMILLFQTKITQLSMQIRKHKTLSDTSMITPVHIGETISYYLLAVTSQMQTQD